MKKAILLLIIAPFVYLIFSSHNTGVTNATFARAGCGGDITCHSSTSNNNTLPIIIVVNKSTGDTIKNGTYNPGVTYTIIVGGVHPTAQRFGFILAALDSVGPNLFYREGFFSNPIPASATHTNSGFIFAHTATLGAPGGFSASVDWTAPNAGKGLITLFLVVNSVNWNGASSGDEWDKTRLDLVESPVSVNTVAPKVDISIYPNPATNRLYFNGVGNTSYNYSVYSLSGSIVSKGQLKNSIDVSTLSSGVYFLKLYDGKTNTTTLMFNKQ
ncbi:MAG: choice-of-anchor V domain-containing protein [Flavipsychrobacter sp.]